MVGRGGKKWERWRSDRTNGVRLFRSVALPSFEPDFLYETTYLPTSLPPPCPSRSSVTKQNTKTCRSTTVHKPPPSLLFPSSLPPFIPTYLPSLRSFIHSFIHQQLPSNSEAAILRSNSSTPLSVLSYHVMSYHDESSRERLKENRTERNETRM